MQGRGRKEEKKGVVCVCVCVWGGGGGRGGISVIYLFSSSLLPGYATTGSVCMERDLGQVSD